MTGRGEQLAGNALKLHRRSGSRRSLVLSAAGAVLAVSGSGTTALADESGASFWLLGSYASQAAVPGTPGWSVDTTYYYGSASADRGASFARGGRIEAGIDTRANYFLVTPSYAFETPILGGQFGFGVTVLAGNYSSVVSATLVAPSGASLSGSTADSMTALGDAYPTATLKWTQGVHNFMTYVTANVPIGAYDINRQATVGLGRWALDGGVGYTYFDEDKGHEISAVVGFTYNFMNPHTAYRSGIDMHVELSASQYLTDRFLVGVAGYFYNQLTGDDGPGAVLGPFMSRVAGVGPQVSYDFVLGGRSASLSTRGYYEFAGQYRPQGWNAWLTLLIALGPPRKAAKPV